MYPVAKVIFFACENFYLRLINSNKISESVATLIKRANGRPESGLVLNNLPVFLLKRRKFVSWN